MTGDTSRLSRRGLTDSHGFNVLGCGGPAQHLRSRAADGPSAVPRLGLIRQLWDMVLRSAMEISCIKGGRKNPVEP